MKRHAFYLLGLSLLSTPAWSSVPTNSVDLCEDNSRTAPTPQECDWTSAGNLYQIYPTWGATVTRNNQTDAEDWTRYCEIDNCTGCNAKRKSVKEFVGSHQDGFNSSASFTATVSKSYSLTMSVSFKKDDQTYGGTAGQTNTDTLAVGLSIPFADAKGYEEDCGEAPAHSKIFKKWKFVHCDAAITVQARGCRNGLTPLNDREMGPMTLGGATLPVRLILVQSGKDKCFSQK